MSEMTAAVDVNQASLSELQAIAGVDAALAVAIVSGRPFFSQEDLFRRLALPEDLRLLLTAEPLPGAEAPDPESTDAQAPASLPESAPAAENAARVEAREPVHAPQPAPAEGYLRRSTAIGWGIGLALAVLVLSLALNLLTLSLLNQGALQYTSAMQGRSLSSQVTTLDQQSNTLGATLDGLRSRVDALDTLSGRVTSLEQNYQDLQTQLDQAGQQVQALQSDLDTLQTQVEDLSTQTARFAAFLDGLRELLAETPAAGGK
jgi:prefoldin subunit 5